MDEKTINLDELIDEDDEVTGGPWYSDQGDYDGAVPADLD